MTVAVNRLWLTEFDISYIVKNIDEFKAGSINFTEAIQMGNFFAALYVKAPLDDRYGNIGLYEKMINVISGDKKFDSFKELIEAIKKWVIIKPPINRFWNTYGNASPYRHQYIKADWSGAIS